MNPLVSIISPCYNGEEYIPRFLDSVLAQDYDNIELIVINDGSTDKTQQILETYSQQFTNKGYGYILLSQPNAGQSAAINKGLEVFTGKYMTWIDSDDALTPNAIRTKVEYMEDNSEMGLSICKIKVLDYDSLSEIGEQKRIPPLENDNLFFDLIEGNNVFYTPGGYMVRSSMFRDAMPTPLHILAPREIGQNYQLLLPIAYKYPVGYIDEYLFYYSIRRGSHSRVHHSFEEKNRIMDIAYSVLSSIANDIEKDELKKKRIMSAIDGSFLRRRMNLLLEYNRTDNIEQYVKSLKDLGLYNKNDRKKEFKIKYPFLCSVVKRVFKFIRIDVKMTLAVL